MTTGSFRLGESSLPHLVRSVACQGSEANLLQCQYTNTFSCETMENAAVVCQGGLKMCVYVCIYVCMVLLVHTSTTIFSLAIFLYIQIFQHPMGTAVMGI